MTGRKLNFFTLGLCGFPYGTASVQKLLLMGRAVLQKEATFTVISNTFLKKNDLNHILTKRGNIMGVEYFTTSPYVFSPQSKILKIYAKTVGILKEVLSILFRIKKVDVIILYSYKYFYVFFWSSLARLFNIPVYLIYFELRSSFTNTKSFIDKKNDEWHDKKSFKYVDGVITISDELINQIRRYAPGKPCFIIPPIVDFEAYDNILTPKQNFKSFLFCGSVAYKEIIDFIIDSFVRIEEDIKGAKLQLIINGKKDDIYNYKKQIELKNLADKIIIQSGLTNEELIQAYKNAYALLIPLRNTKQDIARFPQKIAEYCASKRPIITTPYGDIVKYLDEDSAFYCKAYDISSFSEMMLYVYNNHKLADAVGERSYVSGRKSFDYKSYSNSLVEFMLDENKKS